MEDTNIELRSRSRSKTPFLRSSCDREHCSEGADHLHQKSGRKTPVKRSTPIKQIHSTTGKLTPEPIIEVEEIDASPAHRTRNAMKYSTKLIKTSDYSSEESLDRLAANKREIAQNEKNSKYESEIVTTTSTVHVGGSIGDISGLSPILNERSYHTLTRSHNASRDKSSRLSPAYSACSTDSSFAEQALADASALLDDPRKPPEHLPYRLYHMAGEYWKVPLSTRNLIVSTSLFVRLSVRGSAQRLIY
ncbi:hypothetical protein EVAR_38978_1 [Eumeta japonica]|uniref:Uncharacterized protein n=1 Tax=Eumeta variegata TaxID=151549 RepID=A0A4C1W7M8_EUMVA|nr:hypothetical protein EVAR_38978_1 [Eumeta japonica]